MAEGAAVRNVENDARPAAVSAGVDLTTCDREPIHVPGLIQPHGFMLVVSLTDWTLAHASANVGGFLGRAPDEVLRKPFAEIVSAGAAHSVRGLLQEIMDGGRREGAFNVDIGGARFFDVSASVAGGKAIVEFEPAADPMLGGSPLKVVKNLLARLQAAESLSDLCNMAVRQIRAITGYERVMIYRFAQDGSGEVVAEARRTDLPAFLGLHYPASDIPAQARALYARSPLRLIGDANADGVPLLPPHDIAGRPVDMSHSALRSVSPIHLEYLRNMGVRASMSISITHGGRLWGLIACHHVSAPRVPPAALRGVCELFGQVFSLQLDARIREESRAIVAEARRQVERIVQAMSPEATLFDNVPGYAHSLQRLIPCDGLGVWAGGRFHGEGVVPPAGAMADLIAVLDGAGSNEVFATDSLRAVCPQLRGYADIPAGLLAIPVSRAPRDYLLFFRKEIAKTVAWAGDPAKPVEAGPDGPRLSPRKSFEAWREVVRGTSRPWSEGEREVAEVLRVALLEAVLRRSDQAERERKSSQDRQEVLIAELNHRVKNTLALIQSLIARSRENADTIDTFMANVEGRLSAFTRAHDQLVASGFLAAPLSGLLQAELEPYCGEGRRIALDGPEVDVSARAATALALVVHELTTNAVKYGSLGSATGALDVNWSLGECGDLVVFWRESGGPPVAEPGRRSFGIGVIERTLRFELGGDTRVALKGSGLEATLTVPASHVTAGRTIEKAGQVVVDAEPGPRRPFRALLVEDNLMIALDAEDALKAVGAEGVDIASSVAEAIERLDAAPYDVAILDINLGAGTSLPVAERASELGLPFVFASGYGDDDGGARGRFADVPIVSKPYNRAHLGRALARAIG